ncbi:MAG: hypothetical protein AAF636_13515, partial [Pseudomonadota bacterium]
EDQSPDIRVLTQDFGWQGDGFWLHGPGVTVDNNVVAGASGHAFIYWPLGLVEEGLGEALAEVEIDGVPVEVRPKHVEVPSFDGNIAYGAPKALNIAYLHTDNRDDNDEHQEIEGLLTPVPQSFEDQLQSTFSNFTAWNIELNAIAAPYSGRLTFENIDIIGTGEGGSIGIKLDQFDNENDITVRNVTIDGFDVGLAAQRQGEGLIDGARISARTSDIRISLPDGAPRELDIRNVEFLDESLIYSDLSERVNINLDGAHDLGLAGGLFGDAEGFFDEGNLLNIPPIFLPDRITYETTDGEVLGLYFDLQDPSFVPVVPGGELSDFVSDDIVGLTNGELYEQFGFATGGVPAPSNTTPDFVEGGFSGAPTEANTSFPPEPNPYWVDFLDQFGVEIPWQQITNASPQSGSGAGNDGDENSVPPESGAGAGGGDEPVIDTPESDDDDPILEAPVSDTETVEDNDTDGNVPNDERADTSDEVEDEAVVADIQPDNDAVFEEGVLENNPLLEDDDIEIAFPIPEDSEDVGFIPDRDDMDQAAERARDREELDRQAEQERDEEELELEFADDEEHVFFDPDAGDEPHSHISEDAVEIHGEDDQWFLDLMTLLMRDGEEHSASKFLAYEKVPEPYLENIDWFF